MTDHTPALDGKVALITGGARRLGAAIARALHAGGAKVIIHYNTSRGDAQNLVGELNDARRGSADALQGDLLQIGSYPRLIQEAVSRWGRLDILVNNASTYYPSLFGSVDGAHWEDLLGTNLKGPFFLCQAAAPYLTAAGGCIVNMADINGSRPLKGYAVYCIAKAGLIMMTRALAKEMGPRVRVNAVAPGTILWPEGQSADEKKKRRLIARTVLERQGEPEEIARAILFLVRDATYTTGQIIAVDGGRLLAP